MLDFSQKPLFLAPLAGFTDLPFRSVAKKFGADVTVSEMISSNALEHNSRKTLKMVQKANNENLYSVQLAGNNSETIKRAVEILNDVDGIDILDLNCGCPAPKVSNHGSGSSLLKELDKLTHILQEMKKTSNKKYLSAKVRIGFDKKIPLDILKAVEAGGADFIAVHGRTKTDGYIKERIDYDSIAYMKEQSKIPLIANGEIDSFEKAQFVFEHTKCDGIMIGRGAIGNPWIFYQIKEGQSEITKSKKLEVIKEHYNAMLEFHGEYGVVLFRKILHAYSKGIDGASHFRDNINKEENPKIVLAMIEEFFG